MCGGCRDLHVGAEFDGLATKQMAKINQKKNIFEILDHRREQTNIGAKCEHNQPILHPLHSSFARGTMHHARDHKYHFYFIYLLFFR